MFHLFKRVYLSFDDYIDKSKNRIVISKDNGFDSSGEVKFIFGNTLLEYSTSISELIGPEKKYKNLLQFFEMLNKTTDETNKRLIVYCDLDTFLELSISWIKIILPNADAEVSYGIISSNIFQTKMFGTSELYNSTRMYSIDFEEKKISYETFAEKFNLVNVQKGDYLSFLNSIKKYLSLEFIVSSYLYNNSFKEELKEVALNKLQIGMQQFMYEGKMFILENILNKDVFDLFESNVVYNVNNLKEIENDPTFDIWFDENIWQMKMVGVPNFVSSIKFDTITDAQFEKFSKHLKVWTDVFNNTACKPSQLQPNVDLDSFLQSKLNCLKICRKNSLSDEDLNMLLSLSTDLNSPRPCDSFSIFEWVENEKYNVYLIETIRQAYIKNEKEKLKKYLIG